MKMGRLRERGRRNKDELVRRPHLHFLYFLPKRLEFVPLKPIGLMLLPTMILYLLFLLILFLLYDTDTLKFLLQDHHLILFLLGFTFPFVPGLTI